MANYNFKTDEKETLNDEEIQQSLEEVKQGEVYPIEDVAKEFGIVLK